MNKNISILFILCLFTSLHTTESLKDLLQRFPTFVPESAPSPLLILESNASIHKNNKRRMSVFCTCTPFTITYVEFLSMNLLNLFIYFSGTHKNSRCLPGWEWLTYCIQQVFGAVWRSKQEQLHTREYGTLYRFRMILLHFHPQYRHTAISPIPGTCL